MTNEQIIFNAAISSGLFTKEEANAILSTGRRLPLHTYQEWRRLGYQVKQNEHAVLVLNLWRFTSGKPPKDEQEETASEHAYLAKSHLFTASQVEKTIPAKVKTREELMAYNRMLAQQRKARAVS